MPWTYAISRNSDHQRSRCARAGDDQPCNPEGATWVVTACLRNDILGTRTVEQPLCSNHAARCAAAKGIPWPPVVAP